jgi:hypothetical protein
MPYEHLRILVPFKNRCCPCSCLLFKIGSQSVKIQESGAREMTGLGDFKNKETPNETINKHTHF